MAYLKPPWFTAAAECEQRIPVVVRYRRRLPDDADHPVFALTPAVQ